MADHCNTEPCPTVTALQTTFGNAKWIIGAAGSLFGLAVMFLGWVANDNLAGIRGDLKEAKALLQNQNVAVAQIRLEVDFLKQWRQEVEAGRTVARR